MKASRRDFLKASAAAAGGVVLPWIIPASARGADGAIAPSNRIALATIGCGGQGTGDTVILASKPGTEIVALCDVDKAQIAALRTRLQQDAAQQGRKLTLGEFGDFRELLGRPEVDGVIIATPDHWHVLPAIAAARAGKDIYCEKPLSLTIAEGRALSDTVRLHRRILQVGTQQRSDRNFRHAAEIVRNGRLGRIKTMEVGLPPGRDHGVQPVMPVPAGFDYDFWLGPAPLAPYTEKRCHREFRWIFDYSGGRMTDWGAHHVDIVHWALGLTESGPIAARGQGEFPGPGICDTPVHFRVELDYPEGERAIVSDAFPNGIKFIGETGTLFVSRETIGSEPAGLLGSVIRPDEVHLYRSPDHHANFLDCIRDRREPAAPAEQGHRTATAVHVGNIAMLLGREVRWNPATERFENDEAANRMIARPMRSPWRI